MHYLESATAFSQSKIWQLQREYFNDAGIDAWRNGEVPHYITSNPVVGKTYAVLVLAVLRDLALQGDTFYLLKTYRTSLSNGHVLVPNIGLRCLARSQAFSLRGLELLTADKGEHRLSNLDNNPALGSVTHVSFTFIVNYHALQHACLDQGGLMLLPRLLELLPNITNNECWNLFLMVPELWDTY